MPFPTSLPSNTDPTSSNKLASPSHAALHQSHNAEIVAVETKVGTGASTPTAGKVLRATGTGTSGWAQVDATTDIASLTSATLRSILSDETGTGAAVFATSPTLTTPQVTTSINDTSGNEVIKTPATASAVNEITVTNAATANAPNISATGGDTNIDLKVTPKGTGRVNINGAGAPSSAVVAASETTASTAYTGLATAHTVTVIVGASGMLHVGFGATTSSNNTSNAKTYMSVALSSANVVAASDAYAAKIQSTSANVEGGVSRTHLFTGLAAGSTIVTVQVKVETGGGGSGTGTWVNRNLWAIPLGG